MNKTRIRFIANFPLSIVYGGFEQQCVRTCLSLKSIGADADLLDWHDATQNNYILHLFAPDPMWARIAEYWAKRGPLVISAIAGTPGFRRRSYLVSKYFSTVADMVRQETTFSRTRTLLHRADKVICINPLEKDFFVRQYDLNPDRIQILSHGVDEERYCTPDTIFTDQYHMSGFVLYVGNIIQRKNPVLVAECLNQLGLTGVFIGEQMPVEREYGKRFENLIERSPNLVWIPKLDYKDPLLASAFSAAKVLCLPSIAETQPVVALEAMAAGIPVILGDYPYAYQTPFENTFKVNPARVEDLKTVILSVVNINQRASVRLSPEFGWENIAKRLMTIYSEIS